jgi:tRNA (cmo5U34)-methyltransferase
LFNSEHTPGRFEFDDKVADVFEDMINRSVPGYSTIISMIGLLAQQYCTPNSKVYDLGCSLGAASLAIQKHVRHGDYQLIAVDSSSAMVEKLRKTLAENPVQEHEEGTNSRAALDIRCADILDIDISQASVVVLNFTLQFIPLERRDALIRKIYEGMEPGGILILSEKIRFPDEQLDALFIDSYHRFKEKMGYSALEISQKRSALENVLIPEEIGVHIERAGKAGFNTVDVWFQCFNFASLVAFK